MKKVLIFGTFDILHEGHKYFLKEAKKQGDFLITVVTRDSNVKKQKNYSPINNEKMRVRNLKQLKIANKVILGEKNIKYNLIKKLKPNVICIGYDQKPNLYKAKKILKKLGMKNIILKKIKPYKPHIYKSNLIRKKILHKF